MIFVVVELKRCAEDRSTEVVYDTASFEFGRLKGRRTTHHLLRTLTVDFEAWFTGAMVEVILNLTELIAIERKEELDRFFLELGNRAYVFYLWTI